MPRRRKAVVLELHFAIATRNPPTRRKAWARQPMARSPSHGKHSGKILWLRVPPESDHTPVSPSTLAERLNRLAANSQRINQRLNFRMVADILNRLGQELVSAS